MEFSNEDMEQLITEQIKQGMLGLKIMMANLDQLMTDEVFDVIASCQRRYFDALKRQGFTDDQAVRIASQYNPGGSGGK